jgi:hypothetical protein
LAGSSETTQFTPYTGRLVGVKLWDGALEGDSDKCSDKLLHTGEEFKWGQLWNARETALLVQIWMSALEKQCRTAGGLFATPLHSTIPLATPCKVSDNASDVLWWSVGR